MMHMYQDAALQSKRLLSLWVIAHLCHGGPELTPKHRHGTYACFPAVKQKLLGRGLCGQLVRKWQLPQEIDLPPMCLAADNLPAQCELSSLFLGMLPRENFADVPLLGKHSCSRNAWQDINISFHKINQDHQNHIKMQALNSSKKECRR